MLYVGDENHITQQRMEALKEMLSAEYPVEEEFIKKAEIKVEKDKSKDFEKFNIVGNKPADIRPTKPKQEEKETPEIKKTFIQF